MQVAGDLRRGPRHRPGDEGRRRAVQRLASRSWPSSRSWRRDAPLSGRDGARPSARPSAGATRCYSEPLAACSGARCTSGRSRWAPTEAPGPLDATGTDFAIRLLRRFWKYLDITAELLRLGPRAAAGPPEQGGRAGRRGHDRRRDTERRGPPDRLVAADDADDRRRRRADARAGPARSSRCACSPSTRDTSRPGASRPPGTLPRPSRQRRAGSQAATAASTASRSFFRPWLPATVTTSRPFARGRHPERVALALDDEDRDLDRVELVHPALLGLARRVDGKARQSTAAAPGRLGGPARDPRAGGAAAGDDRASPSSSPAAQVLDHRGPGGVELARGRRRLAARHLVGLLDERDAEARRRQPPAWRPRGPGPRRCRRRRGRGPARRPAPCARPPWRAPGRAASRSPASSRR